MCKMLLAFNAKVRIKAQKKFYEVSPWASLTIEDFQVGWKNRPRSVCKDTL